MKTQSQPGRPRAFDKDAALRAIVRVFWTHGFTRTTYDALVEATGIKRQSLVYAFGDKGQMFQAALDQYERSVVAQVCRAVDHGRTGRAGIEDAFRLWAEAARDRTCRGCLMVSTAGENGGADREIAARVASSRQTLINHLTDGFVRAQMEGDLREGLVPAGLAAAAVACRDGALLHAKNAGDPVFAEAALEGFLTIAFR